MFSVVRTTQTKQRKKSMKITIPVLVVAASVSTLLTGCVTSSEKVDLKRNQIQAIDRVPKAIYGSTRAIIAGDATKIDPYETANDKGVAQALREIDVIHQRVAAQEKMWNEFMNTALDAAGSAVPGGGIGANIAKNFITKIKSADDLATAAGTEAKAAGTAAADAKTAGLKAADTVEKSTDAKLAAVKQDFQTLKVQMDKSQVDISASFQKEFAQMDKEQQAKFKENFLALLAQNGASKADLEKATAKSPGELAAMVTGGGGISIAALLALLRTFQPSRAKDDVDKIKEELAGLKAVTGPAPRT